MAKYKFLTAVDYDRNGRHYEAGEVASLKDWRRADIKSAMKANLIELTETKGTGGGDTWQDKQ